MNATDLSQLVQLINIINALTNLLHAWRRVSTMMTATRRMRSQHLGLKR